MEKCPLTGWSSGSWLVWAIDVGVAGWYPGPTPGSKRQSGNSARVLERARSGANHNTIFGIQALASFSAGSVLFVSSWETLNIINVPVLLGMLVVIFWLGRRQKPR